MGINLDTLPADIIQGPIASGLPLKSAVQLAGVNRRLRANMTELFSHIGQVISNQFSIITNRLRKEQERCETYNFEEAKEIVTAAELVQGVRDGYYALDEDTQHEEGVFENKRMLIANHLDVVLRAFVQKHFPSISKDDLFKRVAGAFLQAERVGLHTAFKRVLGKIYREKTTLVSTTTKFCKKYLVNNDGDILLRAAKLSRLIPKFTIQDLKNIDKLCRSVKQLIALTDSIEKGEHFDRLALALFVPEKDKEYCSRFQTVEKVQLAGPELDFLDLGHNFNFLRSFTSLSKLEIRSGNLDHLPPEVLDLPIKELDIRFNNFDTLPPIPKSTTRFRFSHNPIVAASTANDNLHGKIKERFVEQYEDIIPTFSDTEAGELKNLMFSEMLMWGEVRKGATLARIPFRIQGDVYQLSKQRLIEAYLLAVWQGPLYNVEQEVGESS